MSTIERDILISRVVDGLAGDGDWSALERLGDADPTVWRELATAQRQHAMLFGAVEREIELADHVEAPEVHPSVIRFPGASVKWTGWAAAAAITLVWAAGRGGLGSAGNDGSYRPPADTASLVPVSGAPEQYLQNYIDRGRQDGFVVGQMQSKPVVELRPVQVEGGTAYDVVYARVILERTRLPNVYRLTTDEFGGQFPVRVKLPENMLARPPM